MRVGGAKVEVNGTRDGAHVSLEPTFLLPPRSLDG
jgi:hypothetical protein